MRLRAYSAIQRVLLCLAIASVLSGQEVKVVERAGRVVVTKLGRRPAPAEVGMGLAPRDKLGTGRLSRAVVKMSERWFARIDEETDIEITPAAVGAKGSDELKLALGGVFIFSREEEGDLKIQTPTATGALRGTQLVVRVLAGGTTVMQVLEGEVNLGNDAGNIVLRSGEAGEAEPGRAPRKTAVIEARRLIQWALYYPAVIQPEELGLTEAERRSLASSLESYRVGDLLAALDSYPENHAPASAGARVYRAAVLLATGRVDDARRLIDSLPAEDRGRRALERMLSAVLGIEQPGSWVAVTAGEALAESYYQQSHGRLAEAHQAAIVATERGPASGFTWTRLAELEFCFGRTREASAALEKGLKLGPRNAQAHVLRGFLLSAQDRVTAARASFEEALRLDGGLGNAWLGLGLAKIKQGQRAAGRADLQTAVTVEPARSFLYSYHGKALSADGLGRLAEKDFDRAKKLDPGDPTPWFYGAIHAQQENRYNAAIAEMQASLRLNDNRRVYRSAFLLDQDRAVRSTNLAGLYRNNGMTDVAIRESTRGVESDYTNASAHLFLANSYDALRDPRRVNLRHETAWFNELLLANLLAPIGGGPLSQFVSQQEYSKLLESDGLAGSVLTEWHDDGYFDQQASLYGNTANTSAGVDFAYHKFNGPYANSSGSRKELYWQAKVQPRTDDTLYTLGKWQRQEGGDLLRAAGTPAGNTGLRSKDNQEPGLVLVGWNHRWTPGVHTLFLAGRLASCQEITAPRTSQLILARDPAFFQPGFIRTGATGASEYTAGGLRAPGAIPIAANPDGSLRLSDLFQDEIAPFLGRGPVTGAFSHAFDFATERRFNAYTSELQQLWRSGQNTAIAGGRFQRGTIDTEALLALSEPTFTALFTSPASHQRTEVDFKRLGFYAYDYLNVTPWLTAIAGGAWDTIKRPENFRKPPISSREAESEEAMAKLGLRCSPLPWVTVRGVYSQALGGVTFDDSVRLEPVQIAGFNQAFRTLISESVVGSVEAPWLETWGAAIDGRIADRTWWSISGQWAEQTVDRAVGAFDLLRSTLFPSGTIILPAQTWEAIAYSEDVFAVTLNQLIGAQFSAGVSYQYSRARLDRTYGQIPPSILAAADRRDDERLRTGEASVRWNCPNGNFATIVANWYSQSTGGRVGGQVRPGQPADEFWHVTAQVGHRFRQNRCEISGGVINLTDRDYILSPLTLGRELPHERTFFMRFRARY